MNVGTPYKRAQLTASYDAIVIGSGLGGLTTASLLARHRNQRVLVLERHYTAGGFTHAFERPGWDWDVGVHYVGEVGHERGSVRRIFDHLTDGQLAWADLGDVYDTIVLGDFRFDLVRGPKRLEAALLAAFPHEARGIGRYMRLVQRLGKLSRLYFADRVMPRPLARLLGPALRYPAMRYGRRTTASVVNGLVQDPTLRALLTAQWGDYGLPPQQSSFLMHAILVSHFLHGAAYPVGGASRIARTILPSIERAGGAVVTRAEVRRIVMERGRAVGVELTDGRIIRAPRIVSDAGALTTIHKLLPEDARPRDLAAHSEIRPSLAHLSLYVGFTRSAAELNLPKQNLWLYDSIHHDQVFERAAQAKGEVIPGVLISCAAARDPEFERRHPGHSTAEVITLVPYDWFEEFSATSWKKRGEAYDQKKRELTLALRDILVRALPQVADAIGHLELSTPLTTEHFAGHAQGAIYGLAHTPERFAATWLRPQTEVPGLYLTGADACVAGVAGALMGGVMAASALLGANLMLEVMRGGARPERTLPHDAATPATRDGAFRSSHP